MTYTLNRAEVRDCGGIHLLLEKNLRSNVSEPEQQSEGFVSVDYTPLLERIITEEGIIIAQDAGEIIGYTLPLTKEKAEELPLLHPLLARLNSSEYKGKRVSEHNFVFAGQICVAKNRRKEDIPRKLYERLTAHLAPRYDVMVTEIAAENARSLHVATAKLGLHIIDTYEAEGRKWHILAQDLTPA